MTEIAVAHDAAFADRCVVNTVCFLAVDAVERAGSGHAGLPMAPPPAARVLRAWRRRHRPADLHVPDRDRFVPSAPHGSVLPAARRRLSAAEAAVGVGRGRWTCCDGEILNLDCCGASAPAEGLLAELGFTVENVYVRARALSARGE